MDIIVDKLQLLIEYEVKLKPIYQTFQSDEVNLAPFIELSILMIASCSSTLESKIKLIFQLIENQNIFSFQRKDIFIILKHITNCLLSMGMLNIKIENESIDELVNSLFLEFNVPDNDNILYNDVKDWMIVNIKNTKQLCRFFNIPYLSNKYR